MTLTNMQKLVINSVVEMVLEGIESYEDKSSRLTALKLALSEATSLDEQVFLASCKTDEGSDVESNLWVCTRIIKEILDHPKPQLSYAQGGMFNLVRQGQDSGGHYPEVSAEEVKDYVRQKVAEQIGKLEEEVVSTATIPMFSKEAMEAHIVNVQDGVKGFFNKLGKELHDHQGDVTKASVIIGVAYAITTALQTDLGKEFESVR